MFTEDDKQWIREELQQFNGEFRQISGEFQQIRGELRQISGEFQQIRGELQQFSGKFQQVTAELQQFRGELQQLRGEIERVETSLLTEFHKWASPVEMRQKSHAAAIRALDAEVESIADRMKNLEGR